MHFNVAAALVCLQACLSVAAPAAGDQQVLGAQGASKTKFKCDLPPAVSPKKDGLPDAEDIFSSKEAFKKQVERHTAIVQVPSISYDDLGDVEEDERWLVFFDFHKVLKEQFPIV